MGKQCTKIVRHLSNYNLSYKFLDETVLVIFSIKLTTDSKNYHGRPLRMNRIFIKITHKVYVVTYRDEKSHHPKLIQLSKYTVANCTCEYI